MRAADQKRLEQMTAPVGEMNQFEAASQSGNGKKGSKFAPLCLVNKTLLQNSNWGGLKMNQNGPKHVLLIFTKREFNELLK